MRTAKPGWAAVSPREGGLHFLSISTLGALPWMVSFSYISIFLIKFWSHCLISLPSLFCAEMICLLGYTMNVFLDSFA